MSAGEGRALLLSAVRTGSYRSSASQYFLCTYAQAMQGLKGLGLGCDEVCIIVQADQSYNDQSLR